LASRDPGIGSRRRNAARDASGPAVDAAPNTVVENVVSAVTVVLAIACASMPPPPARPPIVRVPARATPPFANPSESPAVAAAFASRTRSAVASLTP
jgi:hypothetical protein